VREASRGIQNIKTACRKGRRPARKAEDAIRRFREANRRIDLLIADCPPASEARIQVALLFPMKRPGLSVILTSGYPRNCWVSPDIAELDRLGMDSVIVLQKPYEARELLRSIRQLTGNLSAAAGEGG
jgi:hypothetical protein